MLTPATENAELTFLHIFKVSLAAEALAKALPASHRVVAITETEFGYFPPASSRVSVVPGEKNHIFSLSSIAVVNQKH